MKKVSLWFLISLCLIILISFIDYYRYSKVINDFVGSVFSEVSNKYPDIKIIIVITTTIIIIIFLFSFIFN